MKKTTLISLLVVSLLITGTQAFGWPGGAESRGGQDCTPRTGQRMTDELRQQRQGQQQERMAVILELSEEQQQQMQNLRDQRHQQQATLREEMQASRDQLRTVARDGDLDEAGIRAAVQEHADLKAQMMVEGAKHRQQIASILTPEQQQKMEQLRNLDGENRYGNCYGKGGQSRNCTGGDCYPGERSGRRGGQGPRF
ncbi:MAG: Spy/CpxP family protein refolding chaperone [Pelovirga sp.]